jgi:DNA topoisomerase IA
LPSCSRRELHLKKGKYVYEYCKLKCNAKSILGLLDSEAEGTTIPQTITNYLQVHMAYPPRRLESSAITSNLAK